jgi:hypothetical protein
VKRSYEQLRDLGIRAVQQMLPAMDKDLGLLVITWNRGPGQSPVATNGVVDSTDILIRMLREIADSLENDSKRIIRPT